MAYSPTITGTLAAALTEGTASSYTKTGTISFTDLDAGSILTASAAAASLIYKSSAGVDQTAFLTAAQISSFINALSISFAPSYASGGNTTWKYMIADSALDFLGVSETITISMPITVTDQTGLSSMQTLAVTLRGTNDVPTLTASSVGDTSASFTEAAATLGSLTTYSAQGQLTLADLDLTDTHSVSIAPKASGYLGTLSAVLVDTASGNPGSVTWTYSAQDKTLDGLADGQVVNQIYTITVTDKKGGAVTQDVVIKLTGAEDAPVVTGTSTGAISEGTATSYNLTGVLTISDADLTDRPVLSIIGQDLSFKNASGVDVTSSLPQAIIDQLKAAFSFPMGAMASNKGNASWTYSVADSALDFMGRNETITVKTTVQVDDLHGGVVAKDVIVTLRGVNDAVLVKDAANGSTAFSAAIVENQGATASAANDSASGVIAFSDADYSDKHVVTVAAQGTGYLGKFTTAMTDTNNGAPGSVNWNYSVADKALDYLALGETLTQTYRVSITDSKGSTAQQDITVVHVGTDDAASVTGTSHATYYEPLNSANSGPITLDGTLKIADADASDTVSVSLTGATVSIFDANGVNLSTLSPDQLTSAQSAMLTQAQTLGNYLTTTSSTALNAGQVNWSYAVSQDKLAFLPSGYKVTIESDAVVTSSHANGGQPSVVTQPIVVQLVGTDAGFQAKDYVNQAVANTFLASLPQGTSIGCQLPTESLRNYQTLTAADGVNFRSTITVEVTKDGAVFDGVDFRNVQVSIAANNVKFVNCIFNATTSIYASIRSNLGTTGLSVDHCTFDGQKTDSIFQDFILSQGSNTSITNSQFINAPGDCIAIMGGVVSGNFFQGGGYYSYAHSDAIWVGRTFSPVTISNNIIDWRSPADAVGGTNNAIRVSSELGDIDNVKISNNVLLGGNYTITVTNGPTWTNTADQMGKLTNTVIQGNIIDLGRTGEFDTQALPKDIIYTENSALWGTGTKFGDAQSADILSVGNSFASVGGVLGDYVFGTQGSDYIVGGAGQDIIYGGDGNDIIQGGPGRDYLYGGLGADIFLFTGVSDGADNIRDFQQGVDKIDISGLAALSNSSDWSWAGTNHFTGTPLQIRYASNLSGMTSLYVDINGDTIPDFRIDLSGIYNLTMSDLIVHRPAGPSDPAGYTFSDSNIDLTASVATFGFSFASAPLAVVSGMVVLVHADGTMLPISDLSTYNFSDGQISEKDGYASVDDLFYYTKYKSVWQAGIDAETHYASIGWQVGNDPNHFFSTNGYFAAHSAAAGMNPLEYYRTVGWQLGDDPNVNFNTRLYVMMYPDVLTSGLDPLEHYLSIGRAQGRTVYPAIGNVDVNGFDAEYYLLANPSVASSGMSAMDHYLTIGWKQGLKPNAYFDPSYYLSKNPDVALSGVEPLTHFMTTGWMEGRNPGPGFDIKLYLALNPDVAASGVNPLLQFLTTGVFEGRLAPQAGMAIVDTAPVAVGETVNIDAVFGNAVSSATGVLANDTDADLDKLKVSSVNGSMGNLGKSIAGSYGTLVLNADGTYAYTVTSATGAEGSHLSEHFRYVIADGKGAFNSASLDIVLNRPVISSDDATMTKSGSGVVVSATAATGVLANDKDKDGDLLNVGSVGGSSSAVGTVIHGQYGDLQLNQDGSYTYVQDGSAPRIGGVSDIFSYSVGDGHGSVSTSQLVINIGSANTAPTLTGATTGTILESSAASYALTGRLTFADADSDDNLTASVSAQSISLADATGKDISALLTSDQIAAIKAAFSVPGGSVGTNGFLDWNFQIPDSVLHFLAAGEVARLTTRVQVQDISNAVAFQDVVVTITGTNDKPVFDTIDPRDANINLAVTEVAGETGSANSQTRIGALYFNDLDLRDSHTVAVYMKGSGYLGTMTAQVAQEPSANGEGVVLTNFTIPDKRFDVLAANQTLTQTYTIIVTDSKGQLTKQDVNVVLTGAEDLPTISGTIKAAWVEGQATSYVKTGALTFNDVDATDRLTTSIIDKSISYVAADGTDMTSSITDAQATMLKNAFAMAVGDLGKNAGTGNWTYSIDDSALDFIGQNDTFTLNTTVKVDDGMGGTASQVVSVSVRGINDAPTIKAYAAGDAAIAANVNELPAANGKTSLDTAAGSFAFKDADVSDKHTLSIKAAGTNYLGTFTANVGTDTTGGKDGAVNWQFSVADKALDYLTAGQQLTQTYTVSVSDGKGGLVKQDVTITLTGASEQFQFNTTALQTISTFTPGSDKLAFTSAAFGNYAAGTLDPSHFVLGTAATTDTSAQFIYDQTKGKLFYDADGIGSGAAVQVAQLNGNPALHHYDLLIV